MHLYAIQARFGDCFLLEYGENNPEYILIDGGPRCNFDDHLRPALLRLLKGQQQLHAVIISHVDNDHILGVLDMLAGIQYQKIDTGGQPFVDIGELWFNSFSNTIGTDSMEKKIAKINQIAGFQGLRNKAMGMAAAAIREGHQVTMKTSMLGIPVNPGTDKGFFLAAKDRQVICKSNIAITVVGPTKDNLDKLRKEWEEWIKKNEAAQKARKYTRDFAAVMDRSVPNLSSLVLLVNAEDTSILLTGDCRGDHLMEGLIELGLSADGSFHVTIFKVPHHGSIRNIPKGFFEKITADTYVISADGTYGNPDEETLCLIVEAAQKAGRKIQLMVTNETDSTTALQQKYKPAEYGYQITFMDKDAHSMMIV